MKCKVFGFLVFVGLVCSSPFRRCPEGQDVAADGHCIEMFSLKINMSKTNETLVKPYQLFDIPGRCLPGSGLAHDAKCVESFATNVNPSSVPNDTVTTRRPGQKLKDTSTVEPSVQQERKTTSRTTRRPKHRM